MPEATPSAPRATILEVLRTSAPAVSSSVVSTVSKKPPSRVRRVAQSIAAAGIAAAKFLAVIVKFKYVFLIGSMLVSVAAYTWLWGWTFAVGFMLLLAIHEIGHVIELRRQGISATLPSFIPFLGALISMKGRPQSSYDEAKVGLAGPLLGTLASAGVALAAVLLHSMFLRELAYVGFFLNAFNLVPALPFDGGRAVGVLHPRIWLGGLAVLVVLAFVWMSPLLVIMIVIGGLELLHRWRDRKSEKSLLYFAATSTQRATIGLVYGALVAATLYGVSATYLARGLH